MQENRARAERAIAGSEADFAEILLVSSERSSVTQAGLMSENAGPIGSFTGVARAFVANRWGICEFFEPSDMKKALDRAAALAIHSSSPPVPFPMLEAESRDTFNDCAELVPPPDVPLREKTFLCRHYCELLGASIRGGSARVSYEERSSDRVIVNSRGTSVREMEHLGSMRFESVLPGGMVSLREVTSRGSFEPFRGLEKSISEQGERLLVRDTTSVIAPGPSRAVLDPELTGILVHEAFGHLAEADFLETNPAVAQMMRRGMQVASPAVTIIDDSGMMSMPGSMKWDHEGNPGMRTCLVSGGVMQGWLHTAGTASRHGARPTGNARVAEPGRSPEARMTCTYMTPGESSFGDLLHHLDSGLYLRGFMGGATDMDRFSIAVQEVWTVRKGVLHKPVAPVTVSGKVTDILRRVEDIGSEVTMTGVLRGCSRRGSPPVPVSYGGPHIMLGEIRVS